MKWGECQEALKTSGYARRDIMRSCTVLGIHIDMHKLDCVMWAVDVLRLENFCITLQ